jgi:hypothetical protein
MIDGQIASPMPIPFGLVWVAFEQDAIRREDADQLKHLVQRDAGQLLQILLRRVVWANLGPANLEGLIDFGHKELHRSASLHVDEAANWTMLFMVTWKQPHAPRCRAASLHSWHLH